MTEQTKPEAQQPWYSDLQAGDVVAYRFPHETESKAPPKVRPTLVVDVTERNGKPCAVLAYGTSNLRRVPHREAYAVDIADSEEVAAASLHTPTRFHCARTLTVALEAGDFSISPDERTARLGRLSGRSLARLHAVRARRHAERDIRQEARRTKQRKAARPRLVTVEYRGKGRTRMEQRYV